MARFYVYVITNSSNSIFYVGITRNILHRIDVHRKGIVPGLEKHPLTKLIYFEVFNEIGTAIFRERQLKKNIPLKNWTLIKEFNPKLADLSALF